jgi:tellurite methyltransferase
VVTNFTFAQLAYQCPLPIVDEVRLLCASGARVLDIGAGTGRNALFLAQNGFPVDALDGSALAVARLNAFAKTNGLPVRATVRDIREDDPEFRGYSLILCTLVLHHLNRLRATSLLSNARLQAESGTLHVVAAITAVGDFSQEHSPEERFYPSPDEIHCAYQDAGWVIHRAYDERRAMRQRHPNGRPMFNLVSFLTARKPL